MRDKKGRFKKGLTPWNKGVKGYHFKEYIRTKPPTEKQLKALEYGRKIKKGTKLTENQRKKYDVYWNIKLRERMKGKKNINWKGGKKQKRDLDSFRYRAWRRIVFGRDNFTCQICTKRGGYLEAHHINKFNEFPEERYESNNGITVCRGECHRSLDRLSRETEKRTEVLLLGDD